MSKPTPALSKVEGSLLNLIQQTSGFALGNDCRNFFIELRSVDDSQTRPAPRTISTIQSLRPQDFAHRIHATHHSLIHLSHEKSISPVASNAIEVCIQA